MKGCLLLIFTDLIVLPHKNTQQYEMSGWVLVESSFLGGSKQTLTRAVLDWIDELTTTLAHHRKNKTEKRNK